MRRRIITTIETREAWIIPLRADRAAPALCAECENGRLLRPEAAALLSSLSLRAIYRRVEAGSIHFLETADGDLFVCLASLREPTVPGVQPVGTISEGV